MKMIILLPNGIEKLFTNHFAQVPREAKKLIIRLYSCLDSPRSSRSSASWSTKFLNGLIAAGGMFIGSQSREKRLNFVIYICCIRVKFLYFLPQRYSHGQH
jgi:hypothetical protein